jgi:membrane protease YdiL (CAAX protease family)
MIFYNQASCEQLGLISIQSKYIPSALVISILYIIIASCIAVCVQNKTFKVPCSYSFWLTSFSISTIIEEICFRGVLFFLFSELNKKFVIIITSAAFSAIHFPGWHLFPIHSTISAWATDTISIFMLGCILGWIYLKTRSIWATSFLHSINNLLAAGFV